MLFPGSASPKSREGCGDTGLPGVETQGVREMGEGRTELLGLPLAVVQTSRLGPFQGTDGHGWACRIPRHFTIGSLTTVSPCSIRICLKFLNLGQYFCTTEMSADTGDEATLRLQVE